MPGAEDGEELTSGGEKKGENSEDDEQKAIVSNLLLIKKILKTVKSRNNDNDLPVEAIKILKPFKNESCCLFTDNEDNQCDKEKRKNVYSN